MPVLSDKKVKPCKKSGFFDRKAIRNIWISSWTKNIKKPPKPRKPQISRFLALFLHFFSRIFLIYLSSKKTIKKTAKKRTFLHFFEARKRQNGESEKVKNPYLFGTSKMGSSISRKRGVKFRRFFRKKPKKTSKFELEIAGFWKPKKTRKNRQILHFFVKKTEKNVFFCTFFEHEKGKKSLFIWDLEKGVSGGGENRHFGGTRPKWGGIEFGGPKSGYPRFRTSSKSGYPRFRASSKSGVPSISG